MGSYASMLKTGKIEPTIVDYTIPSLVLDNVCISETDRMCSLMGKVKEFGSIPNLYILLAKEGFGAKPKFISEERIVWVDIEGIPLHARTTNTFMRIGSKWGDVMAMEDLVESALYQRRLCKVYWARAKDMHGWNPVFREDKYGYNSSDEESMGVGFEGIRGDTIKVNSKMDDSDLEGVSESSFVQGDKFIQEPKEVN
ncbi:hypothetical protein Tco_0893328 [Tanacetum coccineum]|uniref:Uncharacterized protein n=1 Tax=Tanacetum coccineum TaxID=301880 RepID=A0ABQ5C8J0_9ASTR